MSIVLVSWAGRTVFQEAQKHFGEETNSGDQDGDGTPESTHSI
jgi:hypothetical protein